MKRQLTHLALVLATSLVSCTPIAVTENQSDTFHLISDTELSQGMQNMANRISIIALLGMNDDMGAEQKRIRVISLLDEIESLASSIDGHGSVTNYSVINRYMGSFLYDVSLARQFANRQPPNLVPSQRLIKSCMACHESL